MIDMHCHLLPSIDDGAADIQVTQLLLKEAKENGIDTIFCTPHFSEKSKSRLFEKINEVQQLASESGITLIPGMEYCYSSIDSTDLENHTVQTLGTSHYVLLDFQNAVLPPCAANCFYQIERYGFQAIVAHPERTFTGMKQVEQLKACGVLFQLTAASFLGKFGRKSFQLALQILEQGWCSFIASDAHGKHRGFCMAECEKKIAEHYGQRCADQIFVDAPHRLMEDKCVHLYTPQKLPFLKKQLMRLSGHL